MPIIYMCHVTDKEIQGGHSRETCGRGLSHLQYHTIGSVKTSAISSKKHEINAAYHGDWERCNQKMKNNELSAHSACLLLTVTQ